MEAQRDAEGDDPPPPVPKGYEMVEWDDKTSQVSEFLIWTKLPGVDRASKWHRAQVTKIHQRGSRGGYSHDAKFMEDGNVRGMCC